MGNSELSRWGETWFATAAAWGGVDRGRHQRERHLAQTLQKGRVSAMKMFTGFGGVWWKQLIFSVIRRLGTANSDVPRTIWKRCSVDECGQFLFKNGWYKMVAETRTLRSQARLTLTGTRGAKGIAQIQGQSVGVCRDGKSGCSLWWFWLFWLFLMVLVFEHFE